MEKSTIIASNIYFFIDAVLPFMKVSTCIYDIYIIVRIKLCLLVNYRVFQIKGVRSSYIKLTYQISGIYVSQLMFWDKWCSVDPSNNLIISKYKKIILYVHYQFKCAIILLIVLIDASYMMNVLPLIFELPCMLPHCHTIIGHWIQLFNSSHSCLHQSLFKWFLFTSHIIIFQTFSHKYTKSKPGQYPAKRMSIYRHIVSTALVSYNLRLSYYLYNVSVDNSLTILITLVWQWVYKVIMENIQIKR